VRHDFRVATRPSPARSIAAQRGLAANGAAKDPSYACLKGLRLPVLVVNGSNDTVIPASWDAFCWAAGQAARARGRLIAVYVTSTVEPVPVPGDFAYSEQAAQEVAAELKAEAEQRAAETGVQPTFVRELGDTVHALIRVARSATLTCWSSAGRPRCCITWSAQRAADSPPVRMRQKW
jgi:Universal stress protein family